MTLLELAMKTAIDGEHIILLLTSFVNSLFSIINLLLLNVYFSCNVEKPDVVGEKSFN